MVNDLEIYDTLTLKTKQTIESQQSFDGNPIYALLHEAIYCQGYLPMSIHVLSIFRYLLTSSSEASNWSASRLLPAVFSTSEDPVLFTGEMIYPHMFSNYHALSKFKPVADLLAKDTAWPPLYDVEQLKKNQVPVYAANYIDDMYVAWELSRETVATINNARSFDTNALQHNAVRARNEAVMRELWSLKTGEVD
jgi:hypothetical protein